MPKISERLSAVQVERTSAPGYYADGDNLYLRVALGGSKGWIFRFATNGRTRDMGLGAFPAIGLAAARKLAGRCRELVKQGLDPIEHRRTERAAERVAAAKSLTFEECARQYIADHECAWRNAKHRAQWANTLKTYVYPVFGKLPASEIDSGLVLRALKSIWYTKPETASRVRGRIESVLDWAHAHGYRGAENPARWKGKLSAMLPPRAKVQKTKHHPALPYAQAGAFIAKLRERKGNCPRALEFLILTASRTSEVAHMRESEVDLAERVWIIPADRMKAEREHRVPLCSRAIELLKSATPSKDGLMFPGLKGRPLSDTAFKKVHRTMGDYRDHRGDLITTHGFRSTFRDWAADRTNFAREVAEACIAHALGDEAELAYKRTDFFEKRRRLMDAWATYCGKPEPDAKVVTLRSA
jgi:integrase